MSKQKVYVVGNVPVGIFVLLWWPECLVNACRWCTNEAKKTGTEYMQVYWTVAQCHRSLFPYCRPSVGMGIFRFILCLLCEILKVENVVDIISPVDILSSQPREYLGAGVQCQQDLTLKSLPVAKSFYDWGAGHFTRIPLPTFEPTSGSQSKKAPSRLMS